jgi:gas vesicle protein
MKTNTFFALVTGLAAGAILGVLFAPDKGENTREQLRKNAEDGLDKLRGALEKVEEDVEDLADGLEESDE